MMNLGIARARETMNKGYGGPFGAVIVKDDEVIAVASNTVLKDHDATCHAEINAIREASRILETHDLSGCVLYTTAYPCPMCLGAIIWANIKEVYYGASAIDAEKIGFRDKMIYDYLKGEKFDLIDLKQIDEASCLELFKEYDESNKLIY